MKSNELKPFLKWAGGKRWFVSKYAHYLGRDFRNYLEPFLGSGAVYFHLRPSTAILSDSNKQLIETYQAIKSDWRSVAKLLEQHKENHTENYYYQTRNIKYKSKTERAAQFVYLNRTCWNGLFRVNLRGQFNVPMGNRDTIVFPDEDFHTLSIQLKNARLLCEDFEKIVDMADEGDFIFVDPPYTVKHDTNGFVRYNERIFSWSDQERLSLSLLRAKKRGVSILLTNANHESVRKLYRKHFRIDEVERQSAIAGKSRPGSLAMN